MVTIDQIRWAAYKTYEGPYFRGLIKHVLPPVDKRDFLDEAIFVFASVEGGCFDAYNGYDKCVCSSGLIQSCDASFFSVTDMIGSVAEAVGIDYVNSTLKPALDISRAVFKKNSSKKWRFFFVDGNVEVSTVELQRKLYLNSSGLKGEWTESAKIHAKTWAAAISSIWYDARAREVQLKLTRDRIMRFCTAYSRRVLFDDNSCQDENLKRCLRAAYITFAGNNPTFANNALKIACTNSRNQKWTIEWVIDILFELTFNADIAIYQQRYDYVSQVLRLMYNVNIPSSSCILRSRVSRLTPSPRVKNLQRRLFAMGFYVGEITGAYDDEMIAAMKAFKSSQNLSDESTTDFVAFSMIENGVRVNRTNDALVDAKKDHPIVQFAKKLLGMLALKSV